MSNSKTKERSEQDEPSVAVASEGHIRKMDAKAEPMEDFLDVDTPIPGQNFVCMSFISPEKILKKKELFYISSFLKYITSDIEYPPDLAEDIKATLPKNKLSELTKNNKVSYEDLKETYENFVYTESDAIEKVFFEQNDFTTTVRGLKVRGTYDTRKEADIRAKVLQRKDKTHHIFVGQVGYWLPWDPAAEKVEDQEYAEGELNNLMKKYKENQTMRDMHYEEEKQNKLEEARRKALEQKAKPETGVSGDATDTKVDSQNSLKKINELRNIVTDKENVHMKQAVPVNDNELPQLEGPSSGVDGKAGPASGVNCVAGPGSAVNSPEGNSLGGSSSTFGYEAESSRAVNAMGGSENNSVMTTEDPWMQRKMNLGDPKLLMKDLV